MSASTACSAHPEGTNSACLRCARARRAISSERKPGEGYPGWGPHRSSIVTEPTFDRNAVGFMISKLQRAARSGVQDFVLALRDVLGRVESDFAVIAQVDEEARFEPLVVETGVDVEGESPCSAEQRVEFLRRRKSLLETRLCVVTLELLVARLEVQNVENLRVVEVLRERMERDAKSGDGPGEGSVRDTQRHPSDGGVFVSVQDLSGLVHEVYTLADLATRLLDAGDEFVPHESSPVPSEPGAGDTGSARDLTVQEIPDAASPGARSASGDGSHSSPEAPFEGGPES